MAEWKEYIYRERVTDDGVDGDRMGELVRCRECIRWRRSKSNTAAKVCDWSGYEKTESDYCSWAKRKDDD